MGCGYTYKRMESIGHLYPLGPIPPEVLFRGEPHPGSGDTKMKEKYRVLMCIIKTQHKPIQIRR